MPSSHAPEVIVARFLQSNHYTETLEAFLKEAGLPPDAGATASGDLTLEKILEEKRQYDASVVYEKIGGKEDDGGWAVLAPSVCHSINSLTSPSNILAVHVTPSRTPWTTPASTVPLQLLISTADRKISVLSTSPPHDLQKTVDLSLTHNSPVLSIASISHDAFMTSSMSGHVDLYGAGQRGLESGRHHAKYAVQVIVTRSRIDSAQGGKPFCIAASAGWDQKICIFSFEPLPDGSLPGEEAQEGGSPIGSPEVTISVPSNPESILFVRHPDTDELYLIVGRRDSTYLYYYQLTEEANTDYSSQAPIITVQEAGRQNLAPHANAWISFSPSSLSTCPTDPTLIAIATSHLPHMKLILVRLLFPRTQGHGPTAGFVGGTTQASQARAELAIQDREDAAIALHVSTMAPQTPYSTPQVVWRPGGSGVWVNGDDGVVRGIDTKTGKVVVALKGHEVGSKVRSLWAGMVRARGTGGGDGRDEEEEWLVSGGFDKRVIVWKAGGGDAAV